MWTTHEAWIEEFVDVWMYDSFSMRMREEMSIENGQARGFWSAKVKAELSQLLTMVNSWLIPFMGTSHW
jgi:hypothetical protein